MDQLRDMFRGFDFFNDNPTLVFLILGLVVLLILSNGDLECFFEQNNSLIWIIAIVFILFLFNIRNVLCYTKLEGSDDYED